MQSSRPPEAGIAQAMRGFAEHPKVSPAQSAQGLTHGAVAGFDSRLCLAQSFGKGFSALERMDQSFGIGSIVRNR
jgi:hypothetical protein